MNVGDLVRWFSVQNDTQEEFDVDYGIILKISRSGATEHRIQVLFEDNTIQWICEDFLEVISA